MDGLQSSCYFQVLQSLYQHFGDCTKSTNYNWYNCHFHVLQVFQFIIIIIYLGSQMLYSRIQISLDLWFHSNKKHTRLEKGSIWPDVSLKAATKKMNKMRLCARGSAQGFQARMQGINSTNCPFSTNHKSSP